MNTFVLLSGLIFLLLSIVWSSKTWLNVIIKFLFMIMTIYAGYLLFGPTNIIASLL